MEAFIFKIRSRRGFQGATLKIMPKDRLASGGRENRQHPRLIERSADKLDRLIQRDFSPPGRDCLGAIS